MKRLLSTMLILVLLLQALPVSALAASGDLLTEQELAAAIALTGIGADGAQSNAAYHKGMTPNETWNAVQVNDWLDEQLNTYMYSVEEILSRASVKLAELKQSDSAGYRRFSDDNPKYKGMIDYIQRVYQSAEALREEMRWQQDRLVEQSGLITELGRQYAQGENTLFPSERVRLSFKIREAEAELKDARAEVAEKASHWQSNIQHLQTVLDPSFDGASEEDFPGANVGEWLSELGAYGAQAVENSARVALVNASGSRLGRMSANGSVLANDPKTEFTVLTESQFAIQLYTGKLTDNKFIEGVKVTVLDLKKADAKPITLTTNNKGVVFFDANRFVADSDKNVTVKLDVEAQDQGYRSFGIGSVKLKLGQKRQEPLTPMDGKPYIYSADFKGIDIFRSDFDMLYSDMNDMLFEIHAVVRAPSNNNARPMFSYWKKGDGPMADYEQQWERMYSYGGSAKVGEWTSTLYRITDYWKQLLTPFVSTSQLPFFAFSKDEKAEHIPARIKSVKSAVNEPVDKGGKIFQDVLGNGFQIQFKLPIQGASVIFQLPIKQKLPKINIDPAGFVTITLGSPIAEDWFKKKGNWKNQEMKDYGEHMKSFEKKGFMENYESQFGAAYDYYSRDEIKIMMESKVEFGWFALASGRWLIDNQIEDITHKTVSIRGALGVTIKWSFTATLKFALGPVPFYGALTFGIAVGFSLSGEVSFAFVNGEFKDWRLRFKDVVVNVGVTLTIQVGVGVKGFLDAWLKLIGGLNFRLLLVMSGDEKSTFSGTASISLTAGLTLFFMTIQREVFNKSGLKLFDDIPLSNALPPLQQYAVKSNAPEEVTPASQEPLTYPALNQKVTMVYDTKDARGGAHNAKVVMVGEQPYLFYIGSATGEDKNTYARVMWRNVNNRNYGSLQGLFDTYALNRYKQLHDYAFDVYVEGDLVFLAVTAAREFENGVPVRNAQNNFNQIVYLAALTQEKGNNPEEANLTTKLPRGSYFIAGTKAENYFFQCQEPTVGGSSASVNYDSVDKPRIDYVKVKRENGVSAGIEIYGTLGRVMYSEDDVPYGATGFRMISGEYGMVFYNDASVASGMGDGYARTLIRGTTRSSAESTPYGSRTGRSFGFVALSKQKDAVESEKAAESAIELYEWEMNSHSAANGSKKSIVLDKGYIDHFELIQSPADESGSKARRLVLYTARETTPDGAVREKLYGLYIEPFERNGRDMTVNVTKYAYDLTLPTGKFSIFYVGDTPYIYWLATAPTVDEESEGMYRVWASALDLSTNSMATPSVFAEFKWGQQEYSYIVRDRYVVEDQVNIIPHTVYMTGTGQAYFTADPDLTDKSDLLEPHVPKLFLYSFQEQQKAVLEIKTMIVEDTTVAAGDFEDATILLMNAGNMGITRFDLEFYTLNNGKAVVAETLHADLLHPENSTLTMAGAGKTENLGAGKQAIYRNSDFDYTTRQRDWVLENEKKAYRIYLGNSGPELRSARTVESDTQHIATDVMMPGAQASFTGTLKIPESWSGKTTLYLRVKSISSNSLWGRAIANAAGANRVNAILPNATAPAELTWKLDEKRGKLMLETEGIAANSAVANAVKAGFIANEIETGEPVALNTMHPDVEIDHRVYADGDGSDLLDIIVTNFADTKDSFKLTCEVTLDGGKETYMAALPYYEQALSSRTTQTLTMPISALVPDPENHSSAFVNITAVGREEAALANNAFTVFLGGESELRFVRQPEDATVQEGERASFEVEVEGGKQPYSYQWQVFNPKTGKWVNLKGFNEPTLSREAVEKKWDGARFRCVVTDADGTQIVSREVTPTVRDQVPTGDNTNLPLYLAVALIALAVLALLRKRAVRG